MNQAERRHLLIDELIAEEPRYRGLSVPRGASSQQQLLRSLMNVREPAAVEPETLALQDEYLAERLAERGVVELADIVSGADEAAYATDDPQVFIWQGDITRLAVDAIVNAANSQLLGCFVPCHGCIDNAIHSFAGMQLRQECARIMAEQGHPEPTGQAKITPGFNLPAQHVLHTVGPIVLGGTPTKRDQQLLASCYMSCLDLAAASGCESVAFCCISTGEFGYPPHEAAEVAVATVKAWLGEHASTPMTVVFNVFKDSDLAIYQQLIGTNV